MTAPAASDRVAGPEGEGAGAAGAAAGRSSGLRPEIQLLRAAAVLAVVVNHLWPSRLTGGYLGVDVFFVISGYLITAHLLRELDRTGRIGLRGFWARRARRLLPASLLVLVVTAGATMLFLPATRWDDVLREIAASALYFQNWLLAAEAQDYFASTESPSPVTHYWSLSLEEQFYVVWPLVALGAYAVGRLLGRPRAAVAAAFGAVAAASLAYSVWITAEQPTAAYFVTPARMWQLGIGGLLAFVPTLVRGRHVVALVGWTALLGSTVVFDEASPVPGWVALAPVLGAAAVIWAGDAFLSRVPVLLRPALAAGLWVGAISYSLYLWHWPPVVILPDALGAPLDSADRLLLLAVLLLVSWASTRFVEDPVRRAGWLVTGPARRTFVPAAIGMAVVVVVTQLGSGSVEERRDRVLDDIEAALASNDPCFGARAMANRCEDRFRLRWPDSALLQARTYEDEPTWGSSCLQRADRPELQTCEFGVPREEARLRVALVGDSHGRHWVPAIDELAVEHRWNVVTMLKGSCPVTAAAVRTRNYPEYVDSCRAWNEAVADEVAADPTIDVVITSANSRNYTVDGADTSRQFATPAVLRAMEEGYVEVWRQWVEAGKEVVVLGDVPRMRRGTCRPASWRPAPTRRPAPRRCAGPRRPTRSSERPAPPTTRACTGWTCCGSSAARCAATR
ncbi:acyltransferase family protein [Nocardioides sp. TF02-7]|uniref:acyltransferase family protein n=1 Tax=Nocardioides sp. TF02-7 TaxID=2917724 RepID=UPI001F06EB60|nr:acyltransferase family protein [Nocardioides sp. TF02-7]UMG93056.1 acyltransferase [Nocardioides sp. TF02-7]